MTEILVDTDVDSLHLWLVCGQDEQLFVCQIGRPTKTTEVAEFKIFFSREVKSIGEVNRRYSLKNKSNK